MYQELLLQQLISVWFYAVLPALLAGAAVCWAADWSNRRIRFHKKERRHHSLKKICADRYIHEGRGIPAVWLSKAGTLASLGVWLRQPQTAAPARYALRHQVNRLEGGPPACTLCSGGDYRFEPRPVSGEGADQSFDAENG